MSDYSFLINLMDADTDMPPSELHAHLGYWLRTVSNAVSHSFARRVEAQGVTVAEWVFLRMLYDVEGIAPSLLAARMGMTKGAISKLADRLLAKEFVERRPNPDDGRAHELVLEATGRALVPGWPNWPTRTTRHSSTCSPRTSGVSSNGSSGRSSRNVS